MKMRGMALVTALALMAGADSLAAQREGRGPVGRELRPGMVAPPVQAAGLDVRVGRLLDRRNELQLTDAQVEELLAIQSEAGESLGPIRQELQTVRQGVRDGTLTASEARERMTRARERLLDVHQPLVTRLEEALTPEQRVHLRQGMARGGRLGARGPRGQGVKAPARGERGQRWLPRTRGPRPRGGGGR